MRYPGALIQHAGMKLTSPPVEAKLRDERISISFHHFVDYEGRLDKFPAFIESVIEARHPVTVWEIGAGANPALSREFVERYGIDYTALDAEASELDKATYKAKLVARDICKADDLPENVADLVFSRMACEHFSDGVAAHRNVCRILKPGGVAVHCFPTMYTLPFLVNRAVSESCSRFLLNLFLPRDYYHHDKFPARYHLCRGPIPSQLKKLGQLGFEICEYRGFFGHRYYLNGHLKPLHWLEELKTRILLKSPNPYLTAYATVILRKRGPERGGERQERPLQATA
jgi:SAM-dependent methyltransferase